MVLEQTRKKLKNVFDKYDPLLRMAKSDLRPNWGVGGDGGNAYFNIEHDDVDEIYGAISDLSLIVSSSEGPVFFDIEGHYISEKKAVEELRQFANSIGQQIIRLKEIQGKYKNRQCAHHPADTCLAYHEQLFDLLSEILGSNELKEFETPGLIDRLKMRAQDFEFKEYWNKRRWKYWIHLSTFFLFLAIVGWLIISKEDKLFKGFPNYVILILTGIITMLFNLFFNNHNSFKDSWKIILKGSRRRLKEKLKKAFLENWN